MECENFHNDSENCENCNIIRKINNDNLIEKSELERAKSDYLNHLDYVKELKKRVELLENNVLKD